MPSVQPLKRLTIPINNDEIHEGEESFTLALTNLAGAVFADGSNAYSQVITIVDNETPTLKFAQTTLDVAESVGMAEVVVNLSGATNNPVVITYETVDGTASSPADFTGITNASPETETIAIGDTSVTLRIPIIEDLDAEGNQDFKVKITDASNSVFPESAGFIEATVTIIDNEVPTLTVAESTRSVAENVPNGRFQVTFELSYDAIEIVTFNYRLEGITAIKDTDFIEPTNRAESISANSDETSITIQITPDDMNEGDETFKIVVTDITNAVSSTGLTTFEQIITITDDEMPTLSISNSSFEVAEDVTGGNFIIDYALSGATQTVVSFNYTLTASTATAGTDYTVPNSLTETIAIGNTSGMITIAIDDDDINEGNETFTIAIMGLTGALFSDKTTSFTQEITIVDDELPAIEVASTKIEVDEDITGRKVDVVVNLAGPIKNPVVIGYETINGTAESPSDFTGSAGSSNATQTIPAGMESTTIQIPIINDDRNEGNEEFTLRITHLTRLGATDPQPPIDVTIKVIDNEVPTITLSNSTFEVAENIMGGNFNVNFQLSGETGSLVTFDYALNEGTATNVDDFTTPTDRLSIPIGMTTSALTIPIIVDAENEGNETFTLAISNLM